MDAEPRPYSWGRKAKRVKNLETKNEKKNRNQNKKKKKKKGPSTLSVTMYHSRSAVTPWSLNKKRHHDHHFSLILRGTIVLCTSRTDARVLRSTKQGESIRSALPGREAGGALSDLRGQTGASAPPS